MESKQLLKLDGSDSDEFKEFELPPARSRRPRMRKALAEAKVSGGGRSICSFRCCLFFVISAVLCGIILMMGWMLINIQRDIADMKDRIRKVRSDEQSDLLQSKNIQTSVSQKLATLSKDEMEIKELKAKLKSLSLKFKILNSTVSQMKSQKDSSSVSPNINQDLVLLKKGMADTGGELKKLSDESEGAKKTIALLSKIVKSLKNSLSELKDAVSSLDTNVLPTEPIDTLKPLVSTASPVDKAKDNNQSLKKLSKLLKKLVDGYSELFNNKTKQLNSEISTLKTNIKSLNKTAKINFISLQKSIIILQNVTKTQEVELHTVASKLDIKPLGVLNTTLDAKFLSIVKGLFARLKDHQQVIANLTGRISAIENQASVKDSMKREETVEVDETAQKKTPMAVEHRTKPSEEIESLDKSIASKITTSSGQMKTHPATTNKPRKMKSSIKANSTRSPPPARTGFPTTRALKTTESEATTKSLPSATSTMTGTRPNQTKWETTQGAPFTSVRTPPKRMNVSTVSRYIISSSTQNLDQSVRPTNVTDMGHSINLTNHIDLTERIVPSTGQPRVTIGDVRATTKGSEKPSTLDGDEPEFSMGGEHGSELDGEGDASDDGLFPIDDRLEDPMNPGRRLKHGSRNKDDDADALDRLDDSV